MRNIYSIPAFFLLLMFAFFSAEMKAQCSISLAATDTVICPGDSVTLTATVPPAGGTLLTTLAGGNNHRGNMFNITAINTVTIESFDGHPMGNTDYAIYYKTGTHVSFETTPGAWTLVGTATGVIAMPFGTPTPLPIPVGITIPAGQTYAFYISSTNTSVSQNYTNGTSVGAVYASDANIQFREGTGQEYPFGSTFSPRIWNGVIHYSTASSSVLWSTGSTALSITVAPAATGYYSCSYTDAGVPCTAEDSVMITVMTPPAVSLGPDTSICNPDSVLLDAGNPGSSFVWSTSDTTQTLSVAGSGTFSVMVTDTAGCMGADTVTITANDPPIVALPADTSVCPSDTLMFDAGHPGSTYLWSTSDMTQMVMIAAPAAGPLWVEVTDTNGCSGSDTMNISLLPLPVAGFTEVPLGLDVTFTNTSTDATSYFWDFGDGSNSTDPSPTHTFAGGGSFIVMLIATNGCGSDTAFTTVLLVAISDAEKHLFSIYPNPNAGFFTLEGTGLQSGLFELEVMTLTGVSLLKKEVTISGGVLKENVALEDVPAGMYLVKCTSGMNTTILKVAVK